MNEDLQNEIEAVNSIYGEGMLVGADDSATYIIHLPQHASSIRLQFSLDYPSSPPVVLGSHSSGDNARKGEAAHIVDIFRDALGRLFQPGQVCLFDVVEEVTAILPQAEDEQQMTDATEKQASLEISTTPKESNNAIPNEEQPPWALSDIVVELKSVFIARAASVSSPDQAKQYLQRLLDSDKKVRSATHNITAWRIKGENGITFQDCDDDGETAAGGRVLHLMQLMELWNTMVVVTRWYGGHQLGPKRFSIINTVARDAFVKGNFVEEATSKKKGKR